MGICYYCHVIVESRNRSHFCMHHWKILPKRYPIFIVVLVVFSYFCKRVCPCVGFTNENIKSQKIFFLKSIPEANKADRHKSRARNSISHCLCLKTQKKQSGTNGRTDGRTDGQSDGLTD